MRLAPICNSSVFVSSNPLDPLRDSRACLEGGGGANTVGFNVFPIIFPPLKIVDLIRCQTRPPERLGPLFDPWPKTLIVVVIFMTVSAMASNAGLWVSSWLGSKLVYTMFKLQLSKLVSVDGRCLLVPLCKRN